MGEIKHTPGPWKLFKHEVMVAEGRNQGMTIANIKPFAPAYADEAQANARLIAAAPDLLAALKVARQEIVSWNEEIGYDPADLADDEAMSQIEVAIAKAEGK